MSAAATIQLQSTITCPDCGAALEETMPTDACLFFLLLCRLRQEVKATAG